MNKIWIEVALNGPWGRDRQPGIPVRVDEIVADGIAAADAGAAIIHVHAYDEQTGRQCDNWATYARIIEGIRSQADAIVYPTIPLSGSSYANENAANRFAHCAELAKRGLIEWMSFDPGSVNFVRFDQVNRADEGFTYLNPLSDMHAGLQTALRHRLVLSYAIYEPGFTRLGAALAAGAANLPPPIYRFMFSDQFAWGFPPKPTHLDAHLALLADAAPGATWMVAGLGVDISPLIAHAAARGGHVRVGLEDAPWGSTATNAEWVKRAVALVRQAGAEPAAPADVRRTIDAL